MNDSRLSDCIRKDLEDQNISISKAEAEEIYSSVLDKIIELLDQGYMLDIDDFGSFWRKKGQTTTATFFKPTDNILERINI